MPFFVVTKLPYEWNYRGFVSRLLDVYDMITIVEYLLKVYRMKIAQ